MSQFASNEFNPLGPGDGASRDALRSAALTALALTGRDFSAVQDGLKDGDIRVLQLPDCQKDPVILEAGRECIKRAFSNGDLHHAERVARTLNLTGEMWSSPAFNEAKVDYLICTVRENDPNAGFRARTFTGPRCPDAVRSDPRLVEAVREKIRSGLSGEHYDTDIFGVVPLPLLLADEGFAAEVKSVALSKLAQDGLHSFSGLANACEKYGEWCCEEPMRAAARQFFLSQFSQGEFPSEYHRICTDFKFEPGAFSKEAALRSAALSFLRTALPDLDRAWLIGELIERGLVDQADLSEAAMQTAGEKAELRCLQEGNVSLAATIATHFQFETEVFERPEFVAALVKIALKGLSQHEMLGDQTDSLSQLTTSTAWMADPEVEQAALRVADWMIMRRDPQDARKFCSRMRIGDEDVAKLPGSAGALARGIELSTMDEVFDFVAAEREFISDLNNASEVRADLALLTKGHYEAGRRLHLKTGETLKLLEAGCDVTQIEAAKDWTSLGTALKTHVEKWQEPVTAQGFDRAVEYFGSVEKILTFMDRPRLSRHDALVEMSAIVAMGEGSGLRPSAFYGQVVAQVAKDNAVYGTDDAHRRFNHIARSFRYDETVARCAEAMDIPQVAALAGHFREGPRTVFASWAHLQQFHRLQELLDKRELLDGLRRLDPAERQILGPFVDEVAIRPGARADLAQAVAFLIHPDKFLATSDPHTPLHIHNAKKPSNYLKIPHLDLTGRELTLALAGGTYDQLQQFPPMQIEYRIATPSGEPLTVVATIHKKSDPRGYTVQNDTGSCDSFGSGKQIVCAFNPEISYFSVEIRRDDGSRRAIAQSMLSVNCDAGRPVPEILKSMAGPGMKLENALEESVLRMGTRTLVCDNIEVARNYRGEPFGDIIEKVYSDFFAEYLQAHGQAQGVRTDAILVGEALTPVFASAPRIPNTRVPVAPASYSDNIGPKVIEVTVAPAISDADRSITSYKRSPVETPPPGDDSRIQYLRPSDAMATAYLEEGAYRGNDSLIVSLQAIENTIIATHVNNAVKSRPDLSLKYVSDDGKLQGYLIAFEGRFTEDREIDLEKGERMIYIADLAAHDEVRRMAGGRLAQSFIKLCIDKYATEAEIPPIVAHLREKTSYRLVMAQLERIERQTGIDFEVIEGPPSMSGGDKMFPVVIRAKVPQRIPAGTLN